MDADSPATISTIRIETTFITTDIFTRSNYKNPQIPAFIYREQKLQEQKKNLSLLTENVLPISVS
jgi:hypothetical protein